MPKTFVRRLRSLKPNTASKIIAWLLTLKPILQYAFDFINAASNLDFAISAKGNPRVVAFWNFLVSPLGNICFSVLGFGWLTYFAWRQINRVRNDELSVPVPASQPDKLVDNEPLSAHNLPRMATEKTTFVKGCSDAHLQEIVEYQRKGLRRYVLVEKCEINSSPLSEGKLYLWLTFHVINYSMFYVTVPTQVGAVIAGSICFKGEPLSGTVKLDENRVVDLPPHSRNYVKVRQWVNRDEARNILETLKTSGNLFDFSEMIIPVKGGDKFPNVEEAKLDLTRGMQNADLENKIIELSNANARLRQEIVTVQKHRDVIKELTLALGACYMAYNQTEREELLTKGAFENLVWRIRDALSYHFEDDKTVQDYLDSLPLFSDSVNEQKKWIDAQCFKLREFINEHYPEQLSVTKIEIQK